MPVSYERLARVGHFFLAGDNARNDRHGCLVVALGRDAAGLLPTLPEITALVAARLHLAPPRFRRILLAPPLPLAAPLLVDDPREGGPRLRVLGREGMDAAAFKAALLAYARETLDFTRPLWEIALTPPLADGTAVLVVKLHHAIVEGEGALASLGALLFSRTPGEAPGTPAPWVPAPPPGPARQLGLAAAHQGQRLADVAVRAARAVLTWRRPPEPWAQLRAMRDAYRTQLGRRRPPSRFSRRVGAAFDHQVAVGDSATILEICRRFAAASFDDVILAAVAGGLRRWLERQGEPLTDIVTQMPVNLANRGLRPSQSFTDMPSFMVIVLPVGEPDPVERLHRISAMAAARRQQAGALRALAGPLIHLPMPLYRRSAGLIYDRAFDFHIASLRGPPVALHVLGNPIELAYIMTPVRGRYPLRMAALSFGAKVTIGFGCDPEIIREPEVLARGIEAALAELARAVA